MRKDAIGFFWEDLPTVRIKKEKIRVTPPERTWERADYYPFLDEAKAFDPPMMQYWDVRQGMTFVNDCEVYQNYFLCGLRCMQTGRYMAFEMTDADVVLPDAERLQWIMENCTHLGFNIRNYDKMVIAMALAGRSCQEIKFASDLMIQQNQTCWDILRTYKIKMPKWDIVDIQEVCPLSRSLKAYSGSLHAERMQDLPFAPSLYLDDIHRFITKWYCFNDLNNTWLAAHNLTTQLNLRVQMSEQYNTDLRSKSDAQVAEAVIGEEIYRLSGTRPRTPQFKEASYFRYEVPGFIGFITPELQYRLECIRQSWFTVTDYGVIIPPEGLLKEPVVINGKKYQMGTGGLHSQEKNQAVIASPDLEIKDIDFASFYPYLIITQGLFPKHSGMAFLTVYKSLVDRRIKAKRDGQACEEASDKSGERKWKAIAEALKITINGAFGKLGSSFSILFAPQLLIQTTLSGQLYLLMLIDNFEANGISVVSANTDGIVTACHPSRGPLRDTIIKWFEGLSRMETEATNYLALFSKDVNNYIAVKVPDKKGKIKVKTKGEYANFWNELDSIYRFHKNPVNLVCADAIEKLFTEGKPIRDTIYGCKDVTKFVTVRSVRSGCVASDGSYLGKSVRWYYRKGQVGNMVIAKTGGKVPKSDGAVPLMRLPQTVPEDIDYEWYVQETESKLHDIGYM